MNWVVLLADNDVDFLDTRAEFLEGAGFRVVRAATLADAQRILRDQWVHVAVLDVRLVDDDEVDDRSGLMLAAGSAPAVPKIIVTDHPDTDGVILALRRRPNEPAPAVDYIRKIEGPEAMIAAVEVALQHTVRINRDLQFRLSPDWPGGGFALLAEQLAPRELGVLASDRTDEFADLLRRLCFEWAEVKLDRPLWQRRGRLALPAVNFAPGRPAETSLIVCGQPAQLHQEWHRYQEYLPTLVSGGGVTVGRPAAYAETTHFAAYALGGLPFDRPSQTLGDFYRALPERRIAQGVAASLRATLDHWSRGQSVIAEPGRTGSLRQIWPAGVERWRSQLVDLQREAATFNILLEVGETQLSVHVGETQLAWPNPFSSRLSQIEDLTTRLPLVVVPGVLTLDSVLWETETEVAWLTDFGDLGLAHAYDNWAELEAALRFEQLECLDLLSLFTLERRLAHAPRLGVVDSHDVDRSIRLTLQHIEVIRGVAAQIPPRDAGLYQVAIFREILRRFLALAVEHRLTRVEVIRALHLVMALGLAGGEPATVTAATEGLHLDTEKRLVRVAGRLVRLTPTEFKLLAFLSSRPGYLWGRAAVFEHMWGEVYEPSNSSHNGRLDTNIDRLRRKLEPNPISPRFLLVERGVGFKLMPTGKAEHQD